MAGRVTVGARIPLKDGRDIARQDGLLQYLFQVLVIYSPLERAPRDSFVTPIDRSKDQSASIIAHAFHHEGGLGAGSYGGKRSSSQRLT